METKESIAYKRGITAAYRIEEYEGYLNVINNPYLKETSTYFAWQKGFSDGTEDFIVLSRSD